MRDFCSYLRVSTDKQGVFGLGMEAQREAVSRYVTSRGRILSEYVEVESGRKSDRPQLMAALAECRRRRATLIIAKLDRLSRNVHFISGLMNSDVEFVAVDMPTANRLTIHILAAVAEHEREMISERTKAALAAAKARGVKLGNPRYEEALEKARAALHEKPIPPEVLSLMVGWRGDGMTLRAIATKLNVLHIVSARGFLWYASTVSNALDRFNESQKASYQGNTKERNHENGPSLITSQLNEHEREAMPSFAVPNAGRGTTKEGNVLMPFNIQEGQRMLDLFTSVGADSFLVTKLDINKKVLWCKPYTPREFRDKLLPMMRTAAVRHPYILEDGREVLAGENLIIRPSGTSVSFVQLDDLKADQLDRLRSAAFIIHSTSPGNYQAWFAVSGISKEKEEFKEFMRRVRKAVDGNDKSASHATRVCGTENFKVDYLPDFPVVTTVHGAPGRIMNAQSLSQMGLLAEPEPVQQWATTTRTYSSDRGRIWPSYEKCLLGAPMNKRGTGPDRSLADYTFCKFAAQRGFTVDEIAAELPNVSSKARERIRDRDPGYVMETAKNGARAADRPRYRGRA